MTQRHRFTPYIACAVASVALLLGAPAVAKSQLQTIYQSTAPGDYLIGTHANADGTVFVISSVGPNGSGQILLLTPNRKTYTPSLIKAFACDIDGGRPSEALVADEVGNVWGMANGCGGNPNADPQGTLFELIKPQAGGSWTFKTVVQMPASMGDLGVVGSGYGRVAFDRHNNLYGLATLGCNAEDGCGKIFQVPAGLLDGGKPKSKVKILYTFPTSTSQPIGLVRDKSGNLFGVEYGGGTPHLGAVWEVSPPSSKNGSWTGGNIHEFCTTQNSGSCDDGYGPSGVPALDGKGDLFGTTQYDGGSHTGNGTVWTLVPPAGGDWTFGEVHTFRDPQGQCSPTTDYGLYHPQYNTLLDKKGQILTFMGSGGFFDPCGDFQSAIYGALVSISPVSDADTIVSNQFAAQQHVSGPYVVFSSPSLLGNVIFGTSAGYYDAPTDTYSAGVVFKIMP
jgi:hypothetical protein